MAKKLNAAISAKLGNFFEVENLEKKKTGSKQQKDTYILVHVKHADNTEAQQWLLTDKEYARITNIGLTRALSKYLKKGILYTITIGGCARYIAKIQDLNKKSCIISVGYKKAMQFALRAEQHPESIVKLKRSLFFRLFD